MTTVLPPPRTVSTRDKWSLLASRPIVQLSYYVFFIAFFIGLTMLGSPDDTSQHFRDDHPRLSVPITKVVRLPGSRSRGSYTAGALQFHYNYQVAGKTYSGTVLGSEDQINDMLTVQYVPERPELSRVEGYGTAGGPAWMLVFPGFILCAALKMVHSGYRGMQCDVRLIIQGIVTRAGAVRTASDAIVLQFTLPDGTLHSLVPDAAAPKMKPGQHVEIIYMPENPDAAVRVQAMEEKARAMLLAHRSRSG